MKKSNPLCIFGVCVFLISCNTTISSGNLGERLIGSEQINCVPLSGPDHSPPVEIIDEWQKTILAALPNSRGIGSIGGYCDLPGGNQLVSLVTLHDIQEGSAEGLLLLLDKMGTVKYTSPGYRTIAGDVSACWPTYIEKNILHMGCYGYSGEEEIEGEGVGIVFEQTADVREVMDKL